MKAKDQVFINRSVWDALKGDTIFRITLIERAGFQEDLRVGFYNGQEEWTQIQSPLKETLMNLSIDFAEFSSVYDWCQLPENQKDHFDHYFGGKDKKSIVVEIESTQDFLGATN